jgi:hypothetical protein
MTRRSEIQFAFLLIGLVVWGYGQRVDNALLRYIGIVCFAVATLLRFFKQREVEEGPRDSP